MNKLATLAVGLCLAATSALSNDNERPNILVIMADDVGWASLGSYHGGIKSIQTPNLDQLATEGVRLTDYYAEPSCTAGRSGFMTGQFVLGCTLLGFRAIQLDYTPTTRHFRCF